MGTNKVWLTIGSAGSGKSAISVGLAQLLRNATDLTNGIRLSHHICMASHEDNKTASSFLASLVASCKSAQLPVKVHLIVCMNYSPH